MKHKDNANQNSRKMKGQSRMQDTGNIYTRYRTTTKQTKNQKPKTTKTKDGQHGSQQQTRTEH